MSAAANNTHAVSRNFAILSAGQVASRLLAFATTIRIAQVLLPERFGAIAFATGVLLYAGLLVDFGFDAYGPIEVSRGTSPLNKLVGTVLTFRSMLLLPAYAVLTLFSVLAPVSPLSRAMIELYGVSLIANTVDLSWVFLGSGMMWPAVVAEIITQCTVAIGVYVCVHSPDQSFCLPAFFFAGRILAISFLLITFVRTYGRPKLGIDWTFLKNLLSKALPLCGSQIMSMISNNFDLILIGVLMGTTDAGLYGAATRLVWVPTTLAVAYYTALRPLVASAYIKGFESVENTFRQSVRITTALALGIGTGGIIMIQPVLTQLYGPGYASAAMPAIILLGAFCLMLVSRNYRLVLVSFNQQVIDLRIMTAAAAVNIGLNVALIKPFGIVGAACATLASETLILILDYATTRRLIKHVPLGRYLWRPFLCCAIMASILSVSSTLANVWLKVALGGASYLLLLLAFRIISLSEIQSMLESLKASKKRPSVNEENAAPQLTSAGKGNDQ